MIRIYKFAINQDEIPQDSLSFTPKLNSMTHQWSKRKQFKPDHLLKVEHQQCGNQCDHRNPFQRPKSGMKKAEKSKLRPKIFEVVKIKILSILKRDSAKIVNPMCCVPLRTFFLVLTFSPQKFSKPGLGTKTLIFH